MHLLLLNQYYPPDAAPTGLYLHDLAKELRAQGHAVTVICSKHSYGGGTEYPSSSTLDHVRVCRVSGTSFGRNTLLGRVCDYLTFYVSVTTRALTVRPAPEVVLACTTPPFLGLFARAIAIIRHARHAHWIMDLYPDALVSARLIRKESLPWRILATMARWQWRKARVIAIGPCMAQRLTAYLAGQVTWIPLWCRTPIAGGAADESTSQLRRERNWEPGRLVIGYSGNIGAGHELATLLAAILALGEHGPIWAFTGNGIHRSTLATFAAEHPRLPIQLLPFVPENRLIEHLAAHDVHIVSVAAGWDGVVVPSKLQAVMAIGRPILVVAPETSEPARWVRAAGAGWVIRPGDHAGLLDAIRSAQDPEQNRLLGGNARRAAQRWFNQSLSAAALARCLATPQRTRDS